MKIALIGYGEVGKILAEDLRPRVQASYFFQRTIEHGRRRAEEMREAAHFVRDTGLAPLSASATAERQAWVADLAESGVFGAPGQPGFARSEDWRIEAGRILDHLQKRLR